MNESIYLCPKCENSVRCETWGEWKCTAQKKRIYGYKQLTDPAQCKFYKKRGKNFKEPKCQCETCVENDLLVDDEE